MYTEFFLFFSVYSADRAVFAEVSSVVNIATPKSDHTSAITPCKC